MLTVTLVFKRWMHFQAQLLEHTKNKYRGLDNPKAGIADEYYLLYKTSLSRLGKAAILFNVQTSTQNVKTKEETE